MLAECGIRIICYNFMPVFDWTRTDLAHVLPDGSDCLSFEEEKVRAVDPERGIELPGWGTNHTPAELQALLHSYRGIGEEELWDNCRYFPPGGAPGGGGVRRQAGPPPRRPAAAHLRPAAHRQERRGLRRILFTPDLDSPSNTITFCCGSLGSGADNDLPAMIREFGSRGKLPFVHFRTSSWSPAATFTSPATRPAAAAVTWGRSCGLCAIWISPSICALTTAGVSGMRRGALER